MVATTSCNNGDQPLVGSIAKYRSSGDSTESLSNVGGTDNTRFEQIGRLVKARVLRIRRYGLQHVTPIIARPAAIFAGVL